MVAFLTWLLANPVVIAIVGGVVGMLGIGLQQRRAGAKAAEAKQAQARLEARTEADKIDDAVAGMSDAEVLRRQKEWSRKR
jgi:hypothetical protein